MQALGRPLQRAPDGTPLLYERHCPEQTTLYRLVQQHVASFTARTEGGTGAELPSSMKPKLLPAANQRMREQRLDERARQVQRPGNAEASATHPAGLAIVAVTVATVRSTIAVNTGFAAADKPRQYRPSKPAEGVPQRNP